MTKARIVWMTGLAAVLLWTSSLGAWTLFNTITLGAVVELSGFLADTSRYYRDGYKLAVDRINDKGGITLGGKQYKLALKLLDSKSDPKLAKQQHERLVSKDKVTGLLGPYSGNDVLNGASIAEKYQIPMVEAGSASARVFSRGYRYVFGTLPVAEESFRTTVAMLRQLTPKAKTVGLVSGDDSFDAASAGMTDLLKQAEMELVLHQEYSERIPNFFNILTLVKGKAPDVLFWTGREANAISYVREAKSRNIYPNFLTAFAAGVPAPSFLSVLGKDANLAVGTTPWIPSERLKDRWFGDAAQFAAEYEKKFGYAPDYHAAAAVAAVEAHAAAIEAAGTLDPKRLRDAIAKVDFESLYGRVHFGEDGQIAMPQTVVQIQNGKLIEVFADKFINQPIYPVSAGDRHS
ncbi:MAG TPA: amino acid ABC transporter substrate-binding protein [Xanthobacteraceae bacterium]